jgi:hypothetical protein
MERTRRLSGRQITTMFIAACAAAVLAPVGVMASSHSVVTLGDGTHPSRLAHVSATGAQLVNVTGSTTVGGTVTAVPGVPGRPYVLQGAASSGPVTMSVPTGPRFVVQTMSLSIVVGDTVTVAGAFLTLTENGQAVYLEIPASRLEPADLPAPAVLATTIPISIYPDPGSTITVTSLVDSTAKPSTTVTLSGYRA